VSKIKWLPEALADVERLHAFLKNKNPQAAARAARAILEGAELLKTSPNIGRPMQDDTERRELFISFASGAYVLRYMQEDESTIIIIRVWHSRENRE
jgi:plasmid stabilization system protein ParE